VLKDVGGLMPGHLHGVALVHAARHQVGDGAVARVVEHEAAGLSTHRQPSFTARRLPRLLEVDDAAIELRRPAAWRTPRAVEEVRAEEPGPALGHQPLDDVERPAGLQRHDVRSVAFALLGRPLDHVAGKVNVAAQGSRELPLPNPVVVGERGEVSEVNGQVTLDGLEVGGREVAPAWAVLLCENCRLAGSRGRLLRLPARRPSVTSGRPQNAAG
jgi:hypothetical protein